jgi:excisionase family DNA binding protein
LREFVALISRNAETCNNALITRVNKSNRSETVDGASDGLLNKRELAIQLRISKRTVDAWMRQKRLPFIKIGKTVRFRWPDVLEKLNSFRIN